MKRKYVIIGGSAAGPKTAAKIRRLDGEADITIIQKGKYLSMASCGYPYFVGGVFDDENMLISTPTGVQRDPSFFHKVKDITAIIHTEVTEIDRENKKVVAKDTESGQISEYAYDKLIITTGARPVIPDIPGIDLDGITTLQSMENASYLKEIVKEKKVKHAVIIGAGLIGIETMEALQLAGIKATVIEMKDQVLPFLDWEMARLVENHIRSKGADIRLHTRVEKFIGENGRLVAVELSDGSRIETTLAVVSIGVRPNADLAKKAGLNIGERGGIKVNKFMQTSDPDIFAAGDCTEVTNLITHEKIHWPMGDAANLQGRAAAENAVFGNQAEYDGVVGTGICKVFDFTAGSTGLSEWMAKREGYSNIVTAIQAAPDKPGFMGAKAIVIKLVADKTTGKLLGAQLIGPGDASKRLSIAAVALHAGMHISDLVSLDLPYAPPFSPAIDNFITAVHVLENKWLGRMNGISCTEVKQKIDRGGDGMFLLDVRSPGEYDAMRLGMGETLIPLGALRSSDKLPKDKNREIVAFCKISLRGYEAASYLVHMGYTNIKVMEGGLVAWPFEREK